MGDQGRDLGSGARQTPWRGAGLWEARGIRSEETKTPWGPQLGQRPGVGGGKVEPGKPAVRAQSGRASRRRECCYPAGYPVPWTSRGGGFGCRPRVQPWRRNVCPMVTLNNIIYEPSAARGLASPPLQPTC